MKIVEVQVWKQNLQLTKPYAIANHYFDKAENLFARVVLENGMFGMGAGSPSEFVCGENIDESLNQLLEVKDSLIYRDIRFFHGIIAATARRLPDHPAALACLDIALHDAFAKLQGITIAAFYGQVHQKLPTSITLGILPWEESKHEITEFMKLGFKIVKVKIGENVSQDIELCKAINHWSRGTLKIRVDGNQGYNPHELSLFIRGTQDLGVEFIEQPLPRNEWEKMTDLPWKIRSRTMADEDLHGPEDALRLLAPSALPFGLFNIKLMKCGGITRGKQIADMARMKDIGLMWGCMDESRISISAALHLAFTCANTKYLDLDGHLDLAEDLVQDGFLLHDGYMQLTDGLGLGVQLIE